LLEKGCERFYKYDYYSSSSSCTCDKEAHTMLCGGEDNDAVDELIGMIATEDDGAMLGYVIQPYKVHL